MDCTQAREEFAALLDGELAPEERDAVEGHLSLCSDCLRELDGLKRVDVLYRQLPAVTAPAELEGRVRQEIRSNLILRLPRLVRPRRPMWPALLAAAGVVLAVGLALVWFQAPPLHMQVASLPESTAESAAPAAAPAEEPVVDGLALSMGQIAVSSDEPVAAGGTDNAVSDRITMAPAAPAPEAKAKADAGERGKSIAAFEAQRFESSEAVAPPGAVEADLARPLVADTVPGMPVTESRAYTTPSAPKEEAAKEAPDALMGGVVAAAPPEAQAVPPVLSEGAPVAKRTSNIKGVAKRVFELKDGIWWESGYTGQGTTRLVRGSKELQDLVSKHPELGKALELGEHVVFKSDGRWYRTVPHAGR